MNTKGNYVSEWFGHRIYPRVAHARQAGADQEAGRCPFLSHTIEEDRSCVKASSAVGVCTISSESNQRRQDWLACPYRALQDSLTTDVVRHLFGRRIENEAIFPAPSLARTEVQSRILQRLTDDQDAIVFLQDKLGGEISVSKTDRSPELAFDVTLAELKQDANGEVDVASYGILEIQTMDFHGSYRAAVKNLRDALRLHKIEFSKALENNPQWAGERIEGPNIANVFKRTFYQMMLKFKIGDQEGCKGCALAIPESVWDSWQRHLGKPDLVAREDGCFELSSPGREIPRNPPAWIFVFDIDSESEITPNPIIVKRRVATDADAIAHFALQVAPEAAMGQGGIRLVSDRIKLRLSRFWPGVWATQ